VREGGLQWPTEARGVPNAFRQSKCNLYNSLDRAPGSSPVPSGVRKWDALSRKWSRHDCGHLNRCHHYFRSPWSAEPDVTKRIFRVTECELSAPRANDVFRFSTNGDSSFAFLTKRLEFSNPLQVLGATRRPFEMDERVEVYESAVEAKNFTHLRPRIQ